MEYISEIGDARPTVSRVRYDESGGETDGDRVVAAVDTSVGGTYYHASVHPDGTLLDPIGVYYRGDRKPPPLRRVSRAVFEDYLNYLKGRDTALLRRAERGICGNA